MTLEEAIQPGAEALRDALEAGVDPDLRLEGRPATVVALDAIEEGASLELLDILLDAGARVDGKAEPGEPTPLLVALARGLLEAAGRLLARGASPCVQDDEGDTPCALAVRMGDLGMLGRLIEAGARACLDVPSGPAGLTPLQIAVRRGNVEAVRLLLEASAYPDLRVGYGASARDRVEQASLGAKDPIRLLIEGG